ncbi:hypothetical protein [Kitasatospora paracochleata]|uniref:Uncharacterized protein n=1 Tax=Kitasatospora paracochleata TaxID=58354 RepID=A0ABT1IVU2_9ACTN|nr:hypothetical protein [Kitasatospora paracochleata]MCP2309247.1 hypothetical protein [Kitasatospora paracochleata]
MSKQRVSQLADRDPDWPVPRDKWQQVGRYYFLPWEPVKAYFEQREQEARHGVSFKIKHQRRAERGDQQE